MVLTMSTLDTRTRYIHGFIRLKDHDADFLQDDLRMWLAYHCDEWAFIYHNKDIDDSGILIPGHLHFVGVRLTPTRIGTTIKSIADTLEIDPLSISVSKTDCLNGAIQYLIHKNDKDKYQYDKSDIVCSYSADDLECLLDGDLKIDKLETLLQVINDNTTITGVIKSIGIDNYRIYRNVIWDLFKEAHDINK